MEVFALGGKPGVYSARYVGKQKNTKPTRKILQELKDIDNRQAQFRSVIALIFNETEYIFEGIIKGNTHSPRGRNGFGYDPLFIRKTPCPFVQLTLFEKNKISHR